jgi:hypothetical protein
MNEIWPSPLSEPFWFVLYFVGLAVAVMMLLSLMSGWWTLARQLRASIPPDGDRFGFTSGTMGIWVFPVSYSSCLFVNVGREGIRVAMPFPFRLFHPPLFIPSAMIESAVEKRFLFSRYAKIRIRDHWPRLTIHGRAGRRIIELLGRPEPRSNP